MPAKQLYRSLLRAARRFEPIGPAFESCTVLNFPQTWEKYIRREFEKKRQIRSPEKRAVALRTGTDLLNRLSSPLLYHRKECTLRARQLAFNQKKYALSKIPKPVPKVHVQLTSSIILPTLFNKPMLRIRPMSPKIAGMIRSRKHKLLRESYRQKMSTSMTSDLQLERQFLERLPVEKQDVKLLSEDHNAWETKRKHWGKFYSKYVKRQITPIPLHLVTLVRRIRKHKAERWKRQRRRAAEAAELLNPKIKETKKKQKKKKKEKKPEGIPVHKGLYKSTKVFSAFKQYRKNVYR